MRMRMMLCLLLLFERPTHHTVHRSYLNHAKNCQVLINIFTRIYKIHKPDRAGVLRRVPTEALRPGVAIDALIFMAGSLASFSPVCIMADRTHLQRVHTNARVEHFQFAVACIYDEDDAVDSQRCLGDVGCYNIFPQALSRRLEYFRLQYRRQLRVDGRSVVNLFKSFLDDLTGHFDILLTGHKNQNVTLSRL